MQFRPPPPKKKKNWGPEKLGPDGLVLKLQLTKQLILNWFSSHFFLFLDFTLLQC